MSERRWGLAAGVLVCVRNTQYALEGLGWDWRQIFRKILCKFLLALFR